MLFVIKVCQGVNGYVREEPSEEGDTVVNTLHTMEPIGTTCRSLHVWTSVLQQWLRITHQNNQDCYVRP